MCDDNASLCHAINTEDHNGNKLQSLFCVILGVYMYMSWSQVPECNTCIYIVIMCLFLTNIYVFIFAVMCLFLTHTCVSIFRNKSYHICNLIH